MTAKEFIDMSMDTHVIVRDRVTGKFIKDKEEYKHLNVCGIYAKAHRCGNPPKMRGEIVIFTRRVSV